MTLDGLKIALVDDDESVRTAIARLLRQLGMDARTFGCAADFFAAVGDRHPDCIVLDAQMPDGNGLAIQSRLDALNIRLPIVFISAHHDRATEFLAFQRGAAAFLHKPFSAALLVSAIATAVGCQHRDRRGL